MNEVKVWQYACRRCACTTLPMLLPKLPTSHGPNCRCTANATSAHHKSLYAVAIRARSRSGHSTHSSASATGRATTLRDVHATGRTTSALTAQLHVSIRDAGDALMPAPTTARSGIELALAAGRVPDGCDSNGAVSRILASRSTCMCAVSRCPSV